METELWPRSRRVGVSAAAAAAAERELKLALMLVAAALCEDSGGECVGCRSELRVRPGVPCVPPAASVRPLTRCGGGGGVLMGVACRSEAGRPEEEEVEEEQAGGGVTPGDGSRRDVREDTRLFLSGLDAVLLAGDSLLRLLLLFMA